MRTLSFLLWTTCSVGLGIWLATVPVGSRTPWEHARRLWVQSGITLPEVPGLTAPKERAQGQVRGQGQAAVQDRAPRIAERHTEQERDAVNRLITRGAGK